MPAQEQDARRRPAPCGRGRPGGDRAEALLRVAPVRFDVERVVEEVGAAGGEGERDERHDRVEDDRPLAEDAGRRRRGDHEHVLHPLLRAASRCGSARRPATPERWRHRRARHRDRRDLGGVGHRDGFLRAKRSGDPTPSPDPEDRPVGGRRPGAFATRPRPRRTRPGPSPTPRPRPAAGRRRRGRRGRRRRRARPARRARRAAPASRRSPAAASASARAASVPAPPASVGDLGGEVAARARASGGSGRRRTSRRTAATRCGRRTRARRRSGRGTAGRAGRPARARSAGSSSRRRALVHHPDRLGVQVLEQRGGVGERGADAVGADDRQAVAGQQDLGVERGHRPQRAGPLDRVALHLLRVAAVRRRPDEQVAGAEHLAVGRPDPDVVVGLAAGVVAARSSRRRRRGRAGRGTSRRGSGTRSGTAARRAGTAAG